MTYRKQNMADRVMGSLNILCAFSLLLKMCNQSWHTGRSYWKSQWAWMDLIYAILNMSMSVMIIKELTYLPSLRIIESIAAIFIWFMSLYYMQLFDNIAPLIIIIFKVFKDITSFMKLLFIFIFCFTCVFFLIG